MPIALEPLGVDECGRLVGNLLGGAGLPTQVARSIAEAAGGNPLFVEELVAELIDQGVLTRSDGRWRATADLARVPIPATISALAGCGGDQQWPTPATQTLPGWDGESRHQSARTVWMPERVIATTRPATGSRNAGPQPALGASVFAPRAHHSHHDDPLTPDPWTR
jgi:hypothetical protein